MRLFRFFISKMAFVNAIMGWGEAFSGLKGKKKGLYIQAQRLTVEVMLILRDGCGRNLRPISLQGSHQPVDERWNPTR